MMMIPLRRCHAPLQILLFSFVLFFVALVYYITIDQQQLTTLMVYVPGMRGNVVTERVLTEKTLVGVAQDDPALVNYIRHSLLHPPSRQPYNLSNPAAQHFSQLGQSSYADSEVLHGMTGGFFVEVGAVDGEFLSNTLFFREKPQLDGASHRGFPADLPGTSTETQEGLHCKHGPGYWQRFRRNSLCIHWSKRCSRSNQ
ncbi:uncharacterized protein [Procambarus clarkii]|uniref:uncharacterized protein n=1 Tax=Procambarus clarkii TaxID=6728 RepID=UPI003743C43B